MPGVDSMMAKSPDPANRRVVKENNTLVQIGTNYQHINKIYGVMYLIDRKKKHTNSFTLITSWLLDNQWVRFVGIIHFPMIAGCSILP